MCGRERGDEERSCCSICKKKFLRDKTAGQRDEGQSEDVVGGQCAAVGIGQERAPGSSEIFQLEGSGMPWKVGRTASPCLSRCLNFFQHPLPSLFFAFVHSRRPTPAKEPRQHHLGQTSTAYQRQRDPSISSSILGLNCLVSSGRGGVALPARKHGAGIA